MKLIIGLGNPGKQYEKTRHNAGFIILDALRERWAFSEFQFNKKFNAEVSEGVLENLGTKSPIGDLVPGNKIILAKPQSFMNRSGQVVRAIMDFYKLSPEDITVIHDDLDIDLGTFKVSIDTSSGGHNGVQSIVDHLGTQEFKRIRIGIEGTERKKTRIIAGDAFVLQDFSKEELEQILPLVENIASNL